MKQFILATVAFLVFSTSFSNEVKIFDPGVVSHEVFNSLLQKYVSATGAVNYKGLKAEKAILEQYIAELGKQIPDNSWSKNASLAYWINAYNAFTLKLIIDNYPVKSIMSLSGGKPWDVKWILLAGKKYSLNNIENDIIRPKYKDARIHFAVNCAAISCPPLANVAFNESNLDELLDRRAKNFINSKSNDLSNAKRIKLSNIFDWYKTDFGDIAMFLNKYSNVKIEKNASISYNDYNWALNEQ